MNMLGFSIHRGRMLVRRRRSAAVRLGLVAFFGVAVALFVAEWREGQHREAASVAAKFPVVVVFPPSTDSTDAHFTARQITALYYISDAIVTPAAVALDTISKTAEGLADIIAGNPFPAIARVTLHPEFCTIENITEAAAEIRRIAPECEVKFSHALAGETVTRLKDISVKLTTGIVFTGILMLLLFYFALRSEHLRDPEERRALAAMGAGRLFMALPHIVFSVIAGTVGVVAAIASRTILEFIPETIIRPFEQSLIDSALLAAAVFGIFFIVSTLTAFGSRR